MFVQKHRETFHNHLPLTITRLKMTWNQQTEDNNDNMLK